MIFGDIIWQGWKTPCKDYSHIYHHVMQKSNTMNYLKKSNVYFGKKNIKMIQKYLLMQQSKELKVRRGLFSLLLMIQ